jgi:DNA polymerase-3 subunit delta'
MIRVQDIVGQDGAIEQLMRGLTGSRRHHAWLFVGPEGVGRRTTAEAMAQSLLCGQPADNGTACGQCDDCRLFEAGTHPDFHAVYKELARFHDDAGVRNRVMQELSIDVIRQFLIVPANQGASRNRGKVFVVRQAELMSIAAQNALLKTLEEPPAGVTIILLVERLERLLATTQSRCALVRFGPLPIPFVHERLIAADVPEPQATFWARFAGGSLGTALRYADGELYAIKVELLESLARLSPGGDGDLAETLVKQTDNLASQAVAQAKKVDGATLAKTLASRQAAGTMLQLIASIYRDAITAAAGANRPLIHVDQAPAIDALAERFTLTQLADILDQLSRLEQMLWQNVNPKLVWDNVVITCSRPVPLEA